MVINWSFFEGSDAAGWRGWGIASRAMSGGKCLADIQAHELHSRGPNAIHIQSRQVATEFEPSASGQDGARAMCGVQAAIDSIRPDSPCTGRFVVDATLE